MKTRSNLLRGVLAHNAMAMTRLGMLALTSVYVCSGDVTVRNLTQNTVIHVSNLAIEKLECKQDVLRGDVFYPQPAPCPSVVLAGLNAAMMRGGFDIPSDGSLVIWTSDKLNFGKDVGWGSSWLATILVSIRANADERWMRLTSKGSRTEDEYNAPGCDFFRSREGTRSFAGCSGSTEIWSGLRLKSNFARRDLVIEITGEAPQTDVNVSKGKLTRQLGLAYDGVASRAVDGITDGRWSQNSVTCSAKEKEPWWEVDLGSVVPITRVRLYNRTDCCVERLSNLRVFISAEPFTSAALAEIEKHGDVVTLAHHGVVQGDVNLPVPGSSVQGRYVRVQLVGEEYLSLAEVSVFAKK